ncbi:MAG: response regulator [Thermoanaerobaculales bacterium]|nr:response regulator [Thermoanaerobaculales bacterium]
MKPTILVVDDSVVLRVSVRSSLLKSGYNVVEASNGKEGLEVLDSLVRQNTRPAVILSDINMPEMDGITFIRRLKDGIHRFIPVLVLTTESEQSMKVKGKDAGAAGWIVKPFKEKQLLSVLQKFVAVASRGA